MNRHTQHCKDSKITECFVVGANGRWYLHILGGRRSGAAARPVDALGDCFETGFETVGSLARNLFRSHGSGKRVIFSLLMNNCVRKIAAVFFFFLCFFLRHKVCSLEVTGFFAVSACESG